MFEKARERARERRLGSDARAGRRVRDQVRRTQWAYVRRHWRSLSLGGFVGLGGTALVSLAATNEFERGAIVGAGSVFVVGGLAFTVVLFTGTGSLAMGATAEMWTSSELRPLRRHGWKLADHVFYRFRDIDHLLIGEQGVVVVESKWSATAWDLDTPDEHLSRHLDRLHQSARDLRLSIPPLRQHEHAIRPVLFLWGGGRTGARQPASPKRLRGVDVVFGIEAARVWREQIVTVPRVFDHEAVAAIWSRIRDQATSTDDQDNADPPLPTLTRIYWTAFATFIAAIAAVLGTLYAARLANATSGGYIFATAAAALGTAAYRTKILRHLALGWLSGTASAIVLLIALQLTRR